MALINQNSIIGITSITSPSASNVLTVHTNDTTERLRVSTSGLSFSGTNASLDTSGNISAVDGTFTGNVSIGGTLTYEDVTNIDAVGIITANAGIHLDDVLSHKGNTNTKIRFPAADTITAETNGSERLRITSAGLIGIGTDNPDNYNPNADDLVIFGTGHQGLTIRSGTSHDGSIMFNDTDNANQRGIIRYLHTDDSMAFHTSGGEALRITSGGKLSLTGSAANMEYLRMGGNNDRGLRFTSSSGSSSVGVVHTINAPGDSGAQGAIVLQTNSAERLRIDSSGSAQFKGQNAPSGRDTRISQYGSLLVATTGEILSNARCSIDSGNGNIASAGNGTFAVNTSTYQTGINLNTTSNLSTLTVYSNNSSTHRSLVVYDNAQSGDAKYRAAIYANGSSTFAGAITASSVNLQSSATSSWFQTGTSLASSDYVWAAKNSSSNVWHSGLQTDGDLYLGGNLAGTNNIALNGSNGSGWFSGGLGIGGYAAANTIDEYEEGTLTVALSSSGGGLVYTVNNSTGYYTKIGDVVHAWWYGGVMNITNNGTGSARMSGLPFNSANLTNNYGVLSTTHNTAFTPATDSGYVATNNDQIVFQPTGATSSSNWTQASSRYLMIHAVYKAA